MTTPKHSVEDSMNCAWGKASDACAERYEQCEEKIREAPIASVLFATLAGYLLNFLPVGGALSSLIRLFLFLLKPAIFIFGAVKVVEYIRNQAEETASLSQDGSERDPVIDSPVGPNRGKRRTQKK